MVAEAIAAALVGLAGLLVVLQPFFRTHRSVRPAPEPLDPEETPRGIALAALKEIDFDRETGKLSESDYQFLKARYTARALEALRAEESRSSEDVVEAAVAARRAARTADAGPGPRCSSCGPRPEPDAIYCSSCGVRLMPSAAPEPIDLTDSLRTPA
jgi:hypothetical protein